MIIMHEPDCLTIKGFEQVSPDRIKVVTECDGECFNQNVPKRISHHFKHSKKNFYRFEDGDYFFMKKMRKLYTSENVSKNDYIDELHENKSDSNLLDIDSLVDKLNKDLTGAEI